MCRKFCGLAQLLARGFELLCVAAVFVAMYILILWFTASLSITHNGQVRWAEGWDHTIDHLTDKFR